MLSRQPLIIEELRRLHEMLARQAGVVDIRHEEAKAEMRQLREEVKDNRSEARREHSALHDRVNKLGASITRTINGLAAAAITLLTGIIGYLLINGVPWAR